MTPSRYLKYPMLLLSLWVLISCQSAQGKPPIYDLLLCANQAVYAASVDANGGTPARKILDLPSNSTCPIWSPDGKLALLYRFSQRGLTVEDSLSLIERQNSTIHQVYRFGPRDADWAIRWLPDGITLLLLSARDYQGVEGCSKKFTDRSIGGTECWSYYADVYSTDIHPSTPASLKRLTTTSSPSFKCELAWSPDGRKIAYARAVACSESGPISGLIDGGIDVLDLQTRDVRTLTDPEVGGLYQSNTFLQWSPSGDKILFNALLMPENDTRTRRLLVDDVKGAEIHALAPEGAVIGYWSPDGKKIMWGKGGDTLGVTDVKSNQSHEMQSLKDYYSINRRGWSPDNQHFVWYEWADGGKGKALRVLDVTSGNATTLLADMSVHSWAWSPDGKWLAFSADTFGKLGFYVVKPNGTGPRNLTEGQQLSAVSLGPQGWGSGWSRDNASDVQWVPR